MADAKEVGTILLNILEKLITDYAPQKVILFGSHAWGQPDHDSDIDLLIIKDTDERRFIDRWVTVHRILSDPTRTIGLDTIVLTPHEVTDRQAVGDQFIEQILEKGQVLYER